MQRSPKCVAVEKFNSYYNNYWLNDIEFIKKWCYKEDIRTTNHLEGWHARLNKYVERQNTSLAQVLQFLVKETKIRLRSKTTKYRNYQKNDRKINSAIEDL